MSGWNTSGESAGWNDVSTAGEGEWHGATTNGVAVFSSGDQTANIGTSDVADGTGEAVPGETCYNCGQTGHFARECTEPKKMAKCHQCDEEGHLARDCPSNTKICKICKEDGHTALECSNKMKLNMDGIPDKTQDEAWALLTRASDERDLDDFKEAVKILAKVNPGTTYVQLEKEFRKREFSVYLIGLEKESGDTWTNVDLQGHTGKKFAVGYFFAHKPLRPALTPKWPKDTDDNLERLADAGTPMDRGVEKCTNCHELGHSKRRCPQDIIPVDQVTISCKLCGEEGHRVRDCTEERQKPRAPRTCKICDSEDHLAKECPNKEKRTCRNCGSQDHLAGECDIKKCTNCDAEGHLWRECTAPKDWSRVTCQNCGEKGHTYKRCKEPLKDELQERMINGGSGAPPAGGTEAGGFETVETNNTAASSGGFPYDDAANGNAQGSGQAEWETPTGASVTASGW